MKPLFLITTLGLLTLGALSACSTSSTEEAAADPKEDPRRGEKVNKICFARSIDSFSMASKNSVVLRKGVNQEFLVITSGCYQLRNAQRISVDSTTGCVTRGDYLIVSEDLFANSTTLRPERCVIREVYEWNKKAPDEPTDEGGEE